MQRFQETPQALQRRGGFPNLPAESEVPGAPINLHKLTKKACPDNYLQTDLPKKSSLLLLNNDFTVFEK
jgi:hypothetical protein